MNHHDYSKREHVSQYPSFWVSSKPKPPKLTTSFDVPKLDLRYDSSNLPSDESNLTNENTRAYIERMKKVVL